MALKPFYTPVVLFIVSMFCRCFPFNSSRPVQPPTYSAASVAYRIDVVRAQHNIGASSSNQSGDSRTSNSNLQFVEIWRQKLQNHGKNLVLTKSTLVTYRDQYLVENHNSDLYQCFIESMKIRSSEIPEYVEKHHIQPRFEGGGNEEENLILLSPEEHVFAHFLRYLQYGELQDAAAVLFRYGYNEEARRLNQKASLEKMKRERKGWWNRKEQSEKGKKGGAKGGSANTREQFNSRQNVGKNFGQKTGLGNQSPFLKEVIQRQLAWKHESFPNEIFLTTPSTSGKEIINQLENFVPGQITHESTFYKVLHNERPTMYGWKLVDKGIRSEAEGGKGPSERSETST